MDLPNEKRENILPEVCINDLQIDIIAGGIVCNRPLAEPLAYIQRNAECDVAIAYLKIFALLQMA